MQIELSELVSLLAGRSGAAVEAPKIEPTRKQIVICQRGFVYVGDVAREGSDLVILNAKNIRKWGTTYGLGQLAMEGKTSETKLDLAGTVRVHELAVVARIDCDATKWGA